MPSWNAYTMIMFSTIQKEKYIVIEKIWVLMRAIVNIPCFRLCTSFWYSCCWSFVNIEGGDVLRFKSISSVSSPSSVSYISGKSSFVAGTVK